VIAAAVASLVAALLPCGRSYAHPFGDEYYSHRIVIRADAGTLTLEYSIEYPAQEIMLRFARDFAGTPEVGDDQDRQFAERVFTELGEGLFVLIDGTLTEVEWAPVPDVPNGVGTGRFFVYHIRATTPFRWGGEPVEILVTNDNAINEAAYFSGWIFAGPGLQVLHSSLEGLGIEAGGGREVYDKEGAWSRDPVNRDVSASITRGADPVAAEAPTEALDGWRFPWWLFLLLLAPVAGAVAHRTWGSRRT
jgi:hypothetical protein